MSNRGQHAWNAMAASQIYCDLEHLPMIRLIEITPRYGMHDYLDNTYKYFLSHFLDIKDHRDTLEMWRQN